MQRDTRKLRSSSDKNTTGSENLSYGGNEKQNQKNENIEIFKNSPMPTKPYDIKTPLFESPTKVVKIAQEEFGSNESDEHQQEIPSIEMEMEDIRDNLMAANARSLDLEKKLDEMNKSWEYKLEKQTLMFQQSLNQLTSLIKQQTLVNTNIATTNVSTPPPIVTTFPTTSTTPTTTISSLPTTPQFYQSLTSPMTPYKSPPSLPTPSPSISTRSRDMKITTGLNIPFFVRGDEYLTWIKMFDANAIRHQWNDETKILNFFHYLNSAKFPEVEEWSINAQMGMGKEYTYDLVKLMVGPLVDPRAKKTILDYKKDLLNFEMKPKESMVEYYSRFRALIVTVYSDDTTLNNFENSQIFENGLRPAEFMAEIKKSLINESPDKRTTFNIYQKGVILEDIRREANNIRKSSMNNSNSSTSSNNNSTNYNSKSAQQPSSGKSTSPPSSPMKSKKENQNFSITLPKNEIEKMIENGVCLFCNNKHDYKECSEGKWKHYTTEEARLLRNYNLEPLPRKFPQSIEKRLTEKRVKSIAERKKTNTESKVSHFNSKPNTKTSQSLLAKDYHFFWHKSSVFSNAYPSNYTLEDCSFNCVEQGIAYEKLKMFQPEDIPKLLLISDPYAIKKLGHRNFNEELWKPVCYELMKKHMIAKFSQNSNLLDALLKNKSTKFAEANPNDTLWSIGLTYKQATLIPPEEWPGENRLGKLLDEIKLYFKENSSKLSTVNQVSSSFHSKYLSALRMPILEYIAGNNETEKRQPLILIDSGAENINCITNEYLQIINSARNEPLELMSWKGVIQPINNIPLKHHGFVRMKLRIPHQYIVSSSHCGS